VRLGIEVVAFMVIVIQPGDETEIGLGVQLGLKVVFDHRLQHHFASGKSDINSR